VLLMWVCLPNRPGALGAVATALGRIGADISLVEIVEKRGHVEVDEFIGGRNGPAGVSSESAIPSVDLVCAPRRARWQAEEPPHHLDSLASLGDSARKLGRASS